METSRVRLEPFWQKPCTRMVEASLALLLLFLVLLAVVVVTITLLKKTEDRRLVVERTALRLNKGC